MTDREKQLDELPTASMFDEQGRLLTHAHGPREAALAKLMQTMDAAEKAQPEAWAKFMRLLAERS